MVSQTKTSTEIKGQGRDYLFDNIRAILIALVVWGHLLTSMISHSTAEKIIYYFIFFFHMPAMIFISGYFSKNVEKSRNNAVEKILIPYIILNIANYIFKIFIIKESYFQFKFFRPYWGLWYLLCLFLWKFFLKDIIRIRFVLPFAFAFSIISGFSKEFSNYMSLGRFVGFLPFFLLGYYCTKENIEKIRQIPRIVSFAIIAATGLLSVYIVRNKIMKSVMLFFREPYSKENRLESVFLRMLIYVVAISMIIALINLISNKKSFLSKIGSNTMTVYILHLFTIPILKEYQILYNSPYLYLIYSIAATALIVFIYSRQIVKQAYDRVMGMFVGLILRK